MTCVRVPKPPASLRTAHIRQGERDSFDWPLADVAVALDAGGICRRAAIHPRLLRLTHLIRFQRDCRDAAPALLELCHVLFDGIFDFWSSAHALKFDFKRRLR